MVRARRLRGFDAKVRGAARPFRRPDRDEPVGTESADYRLQKVVEVVLVQRIDARGQADVESKRERPLKFRKPSRGDGLHVIEVPAQLDLRARARRIPARLPGW